MGVRQLKGTPIKEMLPAEIPIVSATGEIGLRSSEADYSEFVVVRPKQLHRWLELILAVLVVGYMIHLFNHSNVVSPAIIRQFLTSKRMLAAVWQTLVLSTVVTVIAIVIGIGVALLRVSDNPVSAGIAAAYIYFFRGTPMLIQLLFWFNALPLMVRSFHVHLPFTEIILINKPTIDVITPFIAALLGLSLAGSGYMAEVIRSGMQGVDRGQRDAARALGLTERTIQFGLVLPQGLRIILPAIGNEYIMMLKSTSLAMVIGYAEILRVTSDIYSVNFHVMELLVVAAFWYLILTSVVSGLQTLVERRFPVK
jgi:polar amino acid transport system permease protein